MGINGTLASMPLAELLRWLGAAGKTGCLQVDVEGSATRIFFRDGRIVGCASDKPSMLLGQYLLFRGIITKDALREAMTIQDGTGRSLMEIFVRMGETTPEALEQAVADKAEETILEIFLARDGAFAFTEGAEPEPYAMALDTDIETVLAKGDRRVEQAAEIDRQFPDAGAVVLARGGGEIPDDPALQRVLAAVNDRRTIAELILQLHGTRFLALSALSRLRQQGLVHLSTDGRAPELSASEAMEEKHSTGDPSGNARSGADEPEGLSLDLDATGGEPSPVATWDHGAGDEADASMDPAYELDPEPSEIPDHNPTGAEGEGGWAGFRDELEEAFPKDEEGDAPVNADAAGEPEATQAEPAAEEIAPSAPGPAAAEGSVAAAVSLIEEARQLMLRGDHEGVVRRLLAAAELDPSNLGIQSLKAGAEAAFLNAMRKRGIHASRLPVPVASWEELRKRQLTPHEDFVIGLADGSWDIKSLVFVAPMETVEVFLAVKSLLDDGLIELKSVDDAGEGPRAVAVGE